MKDSFVELNARERAAALLNPETARELLGPFDELMSPYLIPQGIVPQSDDGIVLMRGKIGHHNALVISMEGDFQGGGIGEVSGAKIFGALTHALEENQKGHKLIPMIIFDTGGVRLQEANYGLLTISEIENSIIALREYVPVIGIVPGLVGSFGGMSITSALTSYLITTNLARVGLNGPEVIEQEAGVREFDSSDKALIWDTLGVNQRAKTGIVDEVVEDNIDIIKKRVEAVIANPPKSYRSRHLDFYLSLYQSINPETSISPEQYRTIFANHSSKVISPSLATNGTQAQTASRGYTWFSKLTEIPYPTSEMPSVLASDVETDQGLRRYITVVPNPDNRYYRARHGEVGLEEGMTIAKHVWDAIEADRTKAVKRPIIMIIDVPGQAFGYKEELIGIHVALAASVDAYATARQLGHPVIGVIVGNAISGAFLAHGLQSNRLIALDDEMISVQAMSKASAARVTQRTIEEIDEAAKTIPAIAYDIQSFNTLGALYALVPGINADSPSSGDVKIITDKIDEAIESLGKSERDFRYRYESIEALKSGRVTTRKVLDRLATVWAD